MAKRKSAAKAKAKPRRATDHADFAGPKADKAEVRRLTAAAERKNRKGRKKAGNGELPLVGGNFGEPSAENIERHLKDIRAATAKYNKASQTARDLKKVVNNYFKTAEGDGIDTKALKRMLLDADRPVGEVVAERRNIVRYERIDGGGIGSQWDLFDEKGAAVAIDAYASGEHSGLNGEPRDNNPFPPGTENAQRWSAGYQSGQAKLARDKFAKEGGDPPEPPLAA